MIPARAFTSTLVLLILAPSALASGLKPQLTPPAFAEDSFRSSVEGSYFSTTNNYDGSGNTVALPAGNYFNEMRLDVDAEYDFTDSFGVYGTTVFKSNTSQTNTYNRSNANFTDIILGTDFLLWSGFVDVIPDVTVDVPLYTSPGADTGVALGSGALQAAGRIHLTHHFKPLTLEGYAGYDYRTEGLSGLALWGANIYSGYKSIFGQLGFNGAVTVADDQYASTPLVRNTVTTAYDGGSYLYYSVNPSWIMASARLGWQFSKLFYVSAGVDQSVTGINSAQGTRMLAIFGFADVSPSKMRASSSHRNSDDFEVDTESEDQTQP